MANRDELPEKKADLPTGSWAYVVVALALGVNVWGFWLIDYTRTG